MLCGYKYLCCDINICQCLTSILIHPYSITIHWFISNLFIHPPLHSSIHPLICSYPFINCSNHPFFYLIHNMAPFQQPIIYQHNFSLTSSFIWLSVINLPHVSLLRALCFICDNSIAKGRLSYFLKYFSHIFSYFSITFSCCKLRNELFIEWIKLFDKVKNLRLYWLILWQLSNAYFDHDPSFGAQDFFIVGLTAKVD